MYPYIHCALSTRCALFREKIYRGLSEMAWAQIHRALENRLEKIYRGLVNAGREISEPISTHFLHIKCDGDSRTPITV